MRAAVELLDEQGGPENVAFAADMAVLGDHFRALCVDVNAGRLQLMPARQAVADISAELALDAE